MRIIKIVAIIAFFVIISIPIICFNTTNNSVSAIDNRTLIDNPFEMEGELSTNISAYINDRIGLRDEMITAYTILNDKLFNKMVHPSYTYGKDGYVFGAGLTTYNEFGDFHIAFADMVYEIQTYCEERNIPFLFVFNPAKPAIYQDKISDSINYNREWVKDFFVELDKRGINYLDNTKTLEALRHSGIDGFNQKYDANHWNDLGAYYGTNAILKELDELCEGIHINELDEFSYSEPLQTSLLVSKFPINEKVPALSLNVKTNSLYDNYFSELDLDSSYTSFGYYINDYESVKETPKVLFFQGSYMNNYGYKYMINAFNEYIHIHDYQNVIDFPYYYNIFRPEVVVFEVAEYTFSDMYFNLENMSNIDYNPSLYSVEEGSYSTLNLINEKTTVKSEKTLTTIMWHTEEPYQYAWVSLDAIYDMKKIKGGYQVTIETKIFEEFKGNAKLYALLP